MYYIHFSFQHTYRSRRVLHFFGNYQLSMLANFSIQNPQPICDAVYANFQIAVILNVILKGEGRFVCIQWFDSDLKSTYYGNLRQLK